MPRETNSGPHFTYETIPTGIYKAKNPNNFMQYARVIQLRRDNVEEWAHMVDTVSVGWSFNQLLDFFNKREVAFKGRDNEPLWRGGQGPRRYTHRLA